MKLFKKISMVYTLQVFVVILLFYPGAAKETALTGNTAIKKKHDYPEKNPDYSPQAAGPTLFLSRPESGVDDFYLLSPFDK